MTEQQKTIFIEIAEKVLSGNNHFSRIISQKSFDNFVNTVSNNPTTRFRTEVPLYYFVTTNEEHKNIIKQLFDSVNIVGIYCGEKQNINLCCCSGVTTTTNIIKDEYIVNIDMRKNNFKIPSLSFSLNNLNIDVVKYIKFSDDIEDKIITNDTFQISLKELSEQDCDETAVIEICPDSSDFKFISKFLLENFVKTVLSNPTTKFKTKFPQSHTFFGNEEYKKYKEYLKYLFDNVNVTDMFYSIPSSMNAFNMDLVVYCTFGITTSTNIIYDKYIINADLRKNNFEIIDLSFTPQNFDPNNINYILLNEKIVDKVNKKEERGIKRERE